MPRTGRARSRRSRLRTRGPGFARPSVDSELGMPLGLGQPPVDDEGLAVLADDHVAGLDVAVEDTSAVGVFDRVADVGEATEELAEGQRPGSGVGLQGLVGVELGDGLLEIVALDEPHGVVGAAVVVVAEAVDRDDPGVFQATGDLGLDQEFRLMDSGCRRGVQGSL